MFIKLLLFWNVYLIIFIIELIMIPVPDYFYRIFFFITILKHKYNISL